MAEEAEKNDAPRVLRVTFEFQVPRGKRVNIRTARRMEFVKLLTNTVEVLAGREFPWAHRMKVRHEWSYAWHDETEERFLRAPAFANVEVDVRPNPKAFNP
jgi:hypothetical protein